MDKSLPTPTFSGDNFVFAEVSEFFVRFDSLVRLFFVARLDTLSV
jgi:hypothetical protein